MALIAENPIVAGTVLRRAAIRSPGYAAGVSGWTVNQDGSAEFNNLTLRGTFFGAHFIINAAGAFFYSGVPATGNLIASITDAAGNDGLPGGGNAYKAGITSYGVSNSYAQLIGNGMQFVAPGSFSSAGSVTEHLTGWLELFSGKVTSGDTPATLSLLSAGALGAAQAVLSGAGSGTPATSALLEVQGSEVASGGVWPKSATPSGAPPAGAEGWNTLGALTGYTVQAGRYRFTPQNEIEIDIEVTAGGANLASVAFAIALPAAYRPLADRHLPLASTRPVTATDPWPRLFVAAATGIVSVLQAASTTASLGGVFRIPLD